MIRAGGGAAVVVLAPPLAPGHDGVLLTDPDRRHEVVDVRDGLADDEDAERPDSIQNRRDARKSPFDREPLVSDLHAKAFMIAVEEYTGHDSRITSAPPIDSTA